MAPAYSTPVTTHKQWRTSPQQKAVIEERLATLPTRKAGKGVGLDTSNCGVGWRKNWGSPWATPVEPALMDAPAMGDFYVRPTFFFAPLLLHERFMERMPCPKCEDVGDVSSSGWNPQGPRKVSLLYYRD
jgi:hypothetical protein